MKDLLEMPLEETPEASREMAPEDRITATRYLAKPTDWRTSLGPPVLGLRRSSISFRYIGAVSHPSFARSLILCGPELRRPSTSSLVFPLSAAMDSTKFS